MIAPPDASSPAAVQSMDKFSTQSTQPNQFNQLPAVEVPTAADLTMFELGLSPSLSARRASPIGQGLVLGLGLEARGGVQVYGVDRWPLGLRESR